MLFSIFVNYIFGLLIYKSRKNKKTYLLIDVVINLLLLVYFKYTVFFIKNINNMFNFNITVPRIVLPIGISFFTFQGMSYVIDIYKQNAQVQKNPFNVALYISLFPQLIAGPIVRYNTIADEINNRDENIENFANGIIRFCIGLGKKVIISNSIGLVANNIFNLSPHEMSVVLTWIAVVAYTFQIYFDFSGYSDMAIGLGKMFGFNFMENFNYPYISKSITEFWRRWHISLSMWFRDYVYIPLGGNRCSILKRIRNIFVVWFLTGFWHGANWNFMVWGIYFAIILSAEKFIYGKYLEKLPSLFQHIYAVILIICGWALFSAPNLSYAMAIIKNMFGIGCKKFIDDYAVYNIKQYSTEFIIAFIASLPIKNVIISNINYKNNNVIYNFMLYYGRSIFAIAIFLLSVAFIVDSTFNPFIYFRF